ncbi:hypothetical protein ABZ078_43325 [Streptomyces sp. NPDC006385]|uniref:hypothetical protein n=1 Tax=Streptomyces sp. NPDC006385 TaxID=3156761 RepID=UPI0033A09E26
MSTRPLSRVGVLAGTVLAVSAGFSGLAQAYTPAPPAASGMGTASQPRAVAADTRAEAMTMKVSMGSSDVGSVAAKHECGTACATHRAHGRGETCCAHCGHHTSGQATSGEKCCEKCCGVSHGNAAGTTERCDCCASSHASQRMPARNDGSSGCCGEQV